MLLLIALVFNGAILMVALYVLTGSFFFTFMTENTMKAIVTNGSLRRFISNVQGKEIDQRDNLLKQLNTNGMVREPFLSLDLSFVFLGKWEWERWFYKKLNLRWVGFPLVNQVLTIPINRVVWDKNKAKIDTVLGRIKVSVKMTRELYHAFPRPIEMKEVDTQDGYRLDLSLLAFFEVYAPYFAFFVLKDSFMLTLDSIVKAYVTERIKGMKWNEFKQKKEVTEGSPEDALFNLKTLSSQGARAGTAVTGLLVDDFGISKSSKDLQDAVEANQIAEERGKAAETAANYAKKAAAHAADAAKNTRTREGEGDAAAIRSKGAAEADTIVAKGKAAMTRREELIKLYERMGFDKRTATEKAIDTVNTELKSNAIGTLTGTYVENGTPAVQTTLPLGGQNKKG
jgi:hypothetical protein